MISLSTGNPQSVPAILKKVHHLKEMGNRVRKKDTKIKTERETERKRLIARKKYTNRMRDRKTERKMRDRKKEK